MNAVAAKVKSSADYTLPIVGFTVLTALLKIFVFNGRGLIDTAAFLLFLSSLYFASAYPIRRWARYAVFILVLAVAVPYIGIKNTFYIDVVTQVAIYAALALGLNIVVGFAGLLDLGFVAFFAIGAYTWGIFGSTQAGAFMPFGSYPVDANAFFIFFLFGIIVAGVFGVLLGLPVLRLRGDYLAIVTLGFGEVIRILANNLDRPINLTNGPMGIASIGQPLHEITNALAQTHVPAFKWQALVYYVMVLGVITVAVLLTRRLEHSRIGRAWVAIREDEIAAQAMGVSLLKTKLIAFATGASFAGAVGVIFAAKQTFISPESFDLNQSIGILAMVVLGGLGSIRGAIIGAAIVTILNVQVLKAISGWVNGLRTSGVEVWGYSFAHLPSQFEISKYERLIFGVILILMMLYRPQGLIPAKQREFELTTHRNHSDTDTAAEGSAL